MPLSTHRHAHPQGRPSSLAQRHELSRTVVRRRPSTAMNDRTYSWTPPYVYSTDDETVASSGSAIAPLTWPRSQQQGTTRGHGDGCRDAPPEHPPASGGGCPREHRAGTASHRWMVATAGAARPTTHNRSTLPLHSITSRDERLTASWWMYLRSSARRCGLHRRCCPHRRC